MKFSKYVEASGSIEKNYQFRAYVGVGGRQNIGGGKGEAGGLGETVEIEGITVRFPAHCFDFWNWLNTSKHLDVIFVCHHVEGGMDDMDAWRYSFDYLAATEI